MARSQASKDQMKAYRTEKYKSDPEFKRRSLERNRRKYLTPEGRVRTNLQQRKSYAKKKNIPFDITIADLIPLPTHCPVSGIELNYNGVGYRQTSPNSPSVDKIIPKLGYVKGNVLIISRRANSIKNDASLEELHALSNFYRDWELKQNV